MNRYLALQKVVELKSFTKAAAALGYTQSWTMNGGSSGELYLSKLEKRLLGCGDRIGARSPVEGLCHDSGN